MSDPLFLWHFSRHVCHGSAVGACWLCGEGNRKGFRGDMVQTSAWSRRASWGCLCLMTSPLQTRSTRWSQGGVRWPSPAPHQVPRLLPCPELCGSLEGQCGGAGGDSAMGGRGKVDNAPWASPGVDQARAAGAAASAGGRHGAGRLASEACWSDHTNRPPRLL